MIDFGNRVEELRLDRGITLRDFCLFLPISSSEYSHMERGIWPATDDPVVLKAIRKALRLAADSQEWLDLMELAEKSCQEAKPIILTERELVGKLPGTLNLRVLSDEQVAELIAMVRREYEYRPEGNNFGTQD